MAKTKSSPTRSVCASCGADDTGTAFCESCGTSMAESRQPPAAAPTPETAPAPATASAPATAPAAQVPAAEAPKPSIIDNIAASTPVPVPALSRPTMWRAVTLVFLLSGALIPTIFSVAVSGLNANAIARSGYEADGSLAVLILAAILFGLAGIASLRASLVSPVQLSRRVGGAILSAAGAALFIFFSLQSAPGYSTVTLGFGTALFLFYAWALTRPIAGLGFLSVPLMFLLAAGFDALPTNFLPWIAAALLNALFLAIVFGVGVAAALAFERSRAAVKDVTFDPAAGASNWPAAARPSTSATYSFVLSTLGFGLPGLIAGHVALRNIGRTGESGRGLAIAGLVIGYLSTLAGLAYVILSAVSIGLLIGSLLNSPYGY